MEEISRINLRPLRQASENMPLHWIGRNSSDSNLSLKNSNFANLSLLDIRKAGVASDVRHSSASEELRRFSDLKRHTALNLLLLESSGWKVEEDPQMEIRKSGGNYSSITSDELGIDQKSDCSSKKTKGNFAKKLLKLIKPKNTRNYLE